MFKIIYGLLMTFLGLYCAVAVSPAGFFIVTVGIIFIIWGTLERDFKNGDLV